MEFYAHVTIDPDGLASILVTGVVIVAAWGPIALDWWRRR